MPTTNAFEFDWLSDLQPAFAAMDSWQKGIYDEDSLFHLIYRPDGPFAISCGAGLLVEHVRRFRFSGEVIHQLSRVSDHSGRALFHESFLNHLQRMRLRVRIAMAPEGMLLLPGEPLAILRGPYAQIQLLESALRWLVWRSTQWATKEAVYRWTSGNWTEEDTPLAPVLQSNPDSWKIRAEYIGGAFADDILGNIRQPSRAPAPDEGLQCIWRASDPIPVQEKALIQIRRVYKANHALGDIWLSEALEEEASVSKTSAHIHDLRTHRAKTLKFTRFQNIYQPVLVKGHPVIAPQRLSYLRQRTLKQLEAFHFGELEHYPHGWFTGS